MRIKVIDVVIPTRDLSIMQGKKCLNMYVISAVFASRGGYPKSRVISQDLVGHFDWPFRVDTGDAKSFITKDT